ncbi:Uncharacterized methyltransferase PH0819 [Geodia barretti]|uniref:Uncharacterized methyltransferase PH0819 n=1 Tax=Geodia barretti TaxID=519541 RepID=A0AA35X1G6_GEOBA|nr:Uncharacterized methyltransferase PH0819 [Geodia barretti]
MSVIELLDTKFDGTPATQSPVSIRPHGDRTRRVMMVQPASAGGNFEYIAIPRQGMLFLSGALAQWDGPYVYERDIWFEDRLGRMDPDTDLDNIDILMLTSLINETPRAYELARQAREFHPELVILGGGPQMSPLPEEAIARGGFDAIVNREGEDIIGQLCDILLTWRDDRKYQYLERVAGISFMRDGHVTQTRRKGLVAPDFVPLPDFRSIRGLSPINPMAGGVLETVRGCTENCSYCQVIQQFLGYRLIDRDTEFRRLKQLEELAADGLIHTGRNGKFNVFISDDLHTPPLRAVKFRNERLERLKGWASRTTSMNMICQARAEIGQDDELADALLDANVKMLYLGVESNNAESLAAVRKRQEPGQMQKDLVHLNETGFSVVAMTIIGLPYDTEESIMTLADWVTQHSRYQTANLLTPLPATSNWDLKPLNAEGGPLQEGEMRPYELYTGRQLVHEDDRWSMAESRELFDNYTAKLTSIDALYGRIFRILGNYRLRQARGVQDLSEATETMRNWSHQVEQAGKELGENLNLRVTELSDTLRSVSQPLSNMGSDFMDNLRTRINETSEALRVYAERADSGSKDVATGISNRVGEVTEMLNGVLDSATHRRNPNQAR